MMMTCIKQHQVDAFQPADKAVMYWC